MTTDQFYAAALLVIVAGIAWLHAARLIERPRNRDIRIAIELIAVVAIALGTVLGLVWWGRLHG